METRREGASIYTPCQTIISLVWFFLKVLLPLITDSYNANWIKYHRSRFSAWVYSSSVLFFTILRLSHCSVASHQNLQIIMSKRKNNGTYLSINFFVWLYLVVQDLAANYWCPLPINIWSCSGLLERSATMEGHIQTTFSLNHLTDMPNIYHVSSHNSTHKLVFNKFHFCSHNNKSPIFYYFERDVQYTYPI